MTPPLTGTTAESPLHSGQREVVNFESFADKELGFNDEFIFNPETGWMRKITVPVGVMDYLENAYLEETEEVITKLQDEGVEVFYPVEETPEGDYVFEVPENIICAGKINPTSAVRSRGSASVLSANIIYVVEKSGVTQRDVFKKYREVAARFGMFRNYPDHKTAPEKRYFVLKGGELVDTGK